MIKWFVGFDQREAVAFHAFMHSLIARSSEPISIIPIKLTHFKKFYNRPIDEKQSNEFSFSRFLVPHLAGYKGFAIWSDCDMLMRTDPAELWALRDELKSVQVVKHNYTPKHTRKYLGATQHKYPRKNWSSMMIFNCAHYHCRRLTPEYVEKASGMELHQLKWTEDRFVGELPTEWNHLVTEYGSNPKAKLVHYTVGGPYFNEYRHCEFADEWFREKALMNHCEQIDIPKAVGQ